MSPYWGGGLGAPPSSRPESLAAPRNGACRITPGGQHVWVESAGSMRQAGIEPATSRSGGARAHPQPPAPGKTSLAAVGRWYVPAVDVSARIVTLELAETFVISRCARDSEDVVQVTLRQRRLAATARRADRAVRRVGRVGARVSSRSMRRSSATTRSRSRRSWRACPAREYAARAAIDAALHDLQGKLVGRPVWQLLGLPRSGPPTSGRSGSATPTTWRRRAEKVAAASSA